MIHYTQKTRPMQDSFLGGRGVGWVLVDKDDNIIPVDTRSMEEIRLSFIANKPERLKNTK